MIVHQHLSEDSNIRTKSVGDGVYKKIKISLPFTAKSKDSNSSSGQKNSRPRKSGARRNGSESDHRDGNKGSGNNASKPPSSQLDSEADFSALNKKQNRPADLNKEALAKVEPTDFSSSES